MAQFLTRQNKDNMTAGEKRFFERLNEYLDDNYLVWYNLPVQGSYRRYPDFLIFHPQWGLLCIEVKDWGMKQLRGVTPTMVTLEQDGQTTQYTHPLEQARSSFLPLINRMENDPYLQQEEGKYMGRLALPWGVGVVMSRWERNKIKADAQQLLESTFPNKQTLYREDILEGSLSQEEFLNKLHAIFPYQNQQTLTTEQIRRIRAYIFPEIIVNRHHTELEGFFNDIEEENSTTEAAQLPEVVRVMDLEQEKIARALGEGHRVIHGVAGAGKTLILEFRARQLAEENPDKPILVICFNKTLAARFRQRLALDNIEVYHFHDWCGQLKDKYDISVFTTKDKKYFDALPEAIYQAIQTGKIPKGLYYAVLIDEGHDLKPEWLEMLVCQPDEKKRFLFLYDGMQGIYKNEKITLKNLGVEARGRTKILEVNYRNSIEISHHAINFITSFIENNHEELINPQLSGEKTGIQPIFHYCNSFNAEKTLILQTIERWIDEGCHLGDIAILCPFKYQGEQVIEFLRNSHLQTQDLIDDKQRKHFALRNNEITVCTIHSSKGLEFPRVIICGIGTLKSKNDEEKYQSARLLYVGMTRAMRHLHLMASSQNPFTDYLFDELVDF